MSAASADVWFSDTLAAVIYLPYRLYQKTYGPDHTCKKGVGDDQFLPGVRTLTEKNGRETKGLPWIFFKSITRKGGNVKQEFLKGMESRGGTPSAK